MSTFTNQCKYCAFKLSEDQSTEAKARFVEDKYRTIRGVKDSPQKTRKISVGGDDDMTETCFIDSPTWTKQEEDIHCPDRIDNSLSLETAMALREAAIANQEAREANKLSKEANSIALATDKSMRREVRKDRIIAITATIIATIAAREDIMWLISWVTNIITYRPR